MAEKSEKSKQNTVKHIPKDAQVIMSMMKDMEITAFEPRVINLLLEFTHRYVGCVLEDAKTYANHAKKKSIDLEDVKLALQIQQEQTFTSPPPRSIVTDVARSKNINQLPLIKPHCGVRLPQDRYCLSSSNVKIKLPEYTKKAVRVGGQYAGNFGERNLKMTPKVNVGLPKRANNLPIISRTQTITIPKPVPKFTNVPPKAVPKPKIHITQSSATPESTTEEGSLKRKRENDEYDLTL